MMLYAILYFLGALAFWMWDYENGVTGWRPFVWAAFWPIVTVVRAARECYWRLGNRLIERRLRQEEMVFWENLGDGGPAPDESDYFLQGTPSYTTVKREADPYYEYTLGEWAQDPLGHEERDEAIAEAVEAARPTLEELKREAFKDWEDEIEDDDGGITFT